jgi:hypothetical protein
MRRRMTYAFFAGTDSGHRVVGRHGSGGRPVLETPNGRNSPMNGKLSELAWQVERLRELLSRPVG